MNTEGSKWIARRRLIAGGKAYRAGTVVPSSALGRNARELERTGYVWLAPTNQPVAGLKPVDLPPPPEPPAKRPKLKIIRLSHPPDTWAESFRENRKNFSNDADTMNFMLSHQEGRDIYKLAVQIAVAEAKAKYKGARQSITPNMVGM
jgi:hypothetical protein